MVDVSQLVSQMHETLSSIHSTISSLSALDHQSRLDELEQSRAAALEALQSSFLLESDDLARKRKAQRDALAEQRRREDEEREARRRQEDEALLAQVADEDRDRHGKLDVDAREVEESTETMMGRVEEEAKQVLDEGKAKLVALEERRKELNRLIDEQLELPLPSAPSRRKSRERSLPEIVAPSNPVDTFDNRDDHGDGDRHGLPTATPTTTEAITAKKLVQETNVVQQGSELVSSTVQTESISENETPFYENQNYTPNATPYIIPGEFPSSALQSPVGDNIAISTVEKVLTELQQTTKDVVSEEKVESVVSLIAPTEDVPEQRLENYDQQSEQQQEHSLSESNETRHEGPPVSITAESIGDSEQSSQIETEEQPAITYTSKKIQVTTMDTEMAMPHV
ncbi:hypothetical protein SPBR_02786 [Sporothrix brasiliensis 5110]|uniref:Uncharacterized protein n=1 Tax=Sporothrix brasiliensis 5110 TaxID=1398154 RepID=A0A0C2J109_9PEZI|nr:uncharacterized protein SPBR_02786 [Sporothrix brasiliensis 5110]KIH92670.1 hypothetical protein SPBR_02786 [Sporothrix brasiliensis 5110]